jgi:hypothetical protein
MTTPSVPPLIHFFKDIKGREQHTSIFRAELLIRHLSRKLQPKRVRHNLYALALIVLCRNMLEAVSKFRGLKQS